jgi:SNF2 family DNA or RNA helicase
VGAIVVRRRSSALWTVEADYYSPALKKAIRRTPGMALEGNQIGLGYVDAVDATVRYLATQKIKVDHRLLPTGPTNVHHLPVAEKHLREYQKVGVDFLIANAPEGAILADDMGLGKSLQSLVVARAFRTKTVVVCLSYVKGTWERAIVGEGVLKNWWPGVKYVVLEGMSAKKVTPIAADVQLVVVNYDIIHAWLEALNGWGARGLIIDECHVVSNPSSRRSKAVKALRLFCSWCAGLSGTPMTNRPRDLFGALDVISPGRMGETFFTYGRVFCDGHQEEIEVRDE